MYFFSWPMAWSRGATAPLCRRIIAKLEKPLENALKWSGVEMTRVL